MDGTLAETEEIHRQSFNRAFEEAGLDWYWSQELYAELLEVNRELDVDNVYAHIALGRIDDLRENLLKGTYHYEWAQCYFDPESILHDRLPDTHGHLCVAQILTVLKWLLEGRPKDALRLLNDMDTVRSPSLWPAHQGQGVFLLVTVMKALLKQDVDLDGDLELICCNHRYLNRQMLYHDAAYLLGRMDVSKFQAQPRKEKLFERWVFVRSLAHDLSGRHEDACKGYRELIDKTTEFEHDNLIRHRFSRWRLKEILATADSQSESS